MTARLFPRRKVNLYTIPDAIRLDADCVLALDAAYGVTQDAARTTPVAVTTDPVGGWTDQSTFGNHEAQSSSAARPTWGSSGTNGQPFVTDSTGAQLGLSGAASLTGNFTLFVAWQSASVGNGRAVRGVSNNWLMGPRSSRISYYAGGFATDAAYATNSTFIHMVMQKTAAGGTGEHWKDGVLIAADISGPTDPGLVNTFSPGTGEPLNGNVYFKIAFKRALSSADRKVVEQFIGGRLGITTPP